MLAWLTAEVAQAWLTAETFGFAAFGRPWLSAETLVLVRNSAARHEEEARESVAKQAYYTVYTPTLTQVAKAGGEILTLTRGFRALGL